MFFCLRLFVILVIFRFGFEGRIWVSWALAAFYFIIKYFVFSLDVADQVDRCWIMLVSGVAQCVRRYDPRCRCIQHHTLIGPHQEQQKAVRFAGLVPHTLAASDHSCPQRRACRSLGRTVTACSPPPPSSINVSKHMNKGQST